MINDNQRLLQDTKITTPSPCKIQLVGKRRDGGMRFWCLEHKADATGKYGTRALTCRYANVLPISADETLSLSIDKFPGGVGLWGAVPPIFDTTRRPLDKGIHVHAREVTNGPKMIDATYRQVDILDNGIVHSITDLDAIYFMISSIFGFDVKFIKCTHCDYAHLDKDWFSVHPHQSHLCAGCGRHFRDTESAIGNPAALLSTLSNMEGDGLKFQRTSKTCTFSQHDYPGGIQIWGSNPAFFWTSSLQPEAGIHVHAFDNESGKPIVDDTFEQVTIDGIKLCERQVRTFMAQSTLPHVKHRIRTIDCSSCGHSQFDEGMNAYVPRIQHVCAKCNAPIPVRGRFRKVVANPIVATLGRLAEWSQRSPQKHDLGLLPETI